MQGDFKGALAAYRKSLEIEPSADAYSNLATTEFYLREFDAAIVDFERSLALGGHDQTVWANYADALWQLHGRRREAIAAYRKAIELGEAERSRSSSDPMLLAQLGYYYERIGDKSSAAKYLNSAAASGASLVYVQYFLARAASDRGDIEGALAAVGKLVLLGYPVALLRSAPEFGELVRHERFQQLLNPSNKA